MKSGLIVGFCLLSILCSCNAADPTLKAETTDRDLKSGVTGTDKIKLRYFTSNDYTNSDANAPILVHLTYDEDAEKSNAHHGYIFSVAKQLNATVAILEHRYFGQSLVADKVPTVYTEIENIGPDQATADFSAVIELIRNNNKNRKIILSGSGYAAELATIMRLNDKTGTDQVFYASIISNAPLRLHQGSDVKLNAFDNKVNEIYKNEGCPMTKLKDAITALLYDNVVKAEAGKIVDTLKLNDNEDGYYKSNRETLVNYIYSAYVGLAQQNYDMTRKISDKVTYSARPVKAFCKQVTDAQVGTEIEKKIIPVKLLIDAYYQQSGETGDKHNYKDTGDLRRNYVDCTITSPYHCSQGPENDYFEKNCANGDDTANWEKNRKSLCDIVKDLDTTTIKFDVMKTQLKNFAFGDLKNVIYINGEYDPNNVGAIASVDTSKNQYKFDIAGATASAHLITPTSCDPDNVKEVRFRTINILTCWLGGTTNGNCDPSKFTPALPNYAASSDTTTCSDQTFGYPWGRDTSDPGKGGKGGDSSTKKPSSGGDSGSMAASTFFAHIPLLTFVIYMFLA